MKVRVGFVSNSSTSSFCIYGVFLDEVPAYLKDGKDEAKDEKNEEDEYEDDDEDEYELMESRASELGLAHHYPDGFGGHYVGLSWSGIKDDETGRAFKDRVEKLVAEFCGEKTACETLEEAWHD